MANTCPGNIEQSLGCAYYSGSDEHQIDAQHEDFMRRGGMGFATHLDSFNACMSAHLQAAHRMPFEEADAIMSKKEKTPKLGAS